MLWREHDQSKFLENFSYKPRISQLTTNFNTLVIALKLHPSSFTKATIFFRSYLCNYY